MGRPRRVERPELRDALAWQVNASKYVATNNAIRVTTWRCGWSDRPDLRAACHWKRYFRDARAAWATRRWTIFRADADRQVRAWAVTASKKEVHATFAGADF